jgi:hypothetical protein
VSKLVKFNFTFLKINIINNIISILLIIHGGPGVGIQHTKIRVG